MAYYPWTLVFVNIILAITRFLVVASIGAAIAVYSRLRGEHANSIRWVRQGGYLEMFNFLINTRNDISLQAKTALLFTILATLAAAIMGRGAVRFIEPTTRATNPSSAIVNTKQYLPLGESMFSGWSKSIRNISTAVDTVVAMIGDTKLIPDAVEGRIYTPKLSPYESGCDKLDIYAMLDDSRALLENNGCAKTTLSIRGAPIVFNTKTMRKKKRSDSRWSVSVKSESFNFYNDLVMNIAVDRDGEVCTLPNTFRSVTLEPTNGLTILPMTSIKKCVFPSGRVTTITVSDMNFVITPSNFFNETSKEIFDDYDELFQAMEPVIQNATAGPGNITSVFSEMRIQGTSINVLTCAPTRYLPWELIDDFNGDYTNPNFKDITLCLYVVAEINMLKEKRIDPQIISEFGGVLPEMKDESISMQITYLRSAGQAQFSISSIRNATAAISQYFAELGYNFLADLTKSRLIVLYDTIDIEHGLEIPQWLIILVPVIASCCLVFLVATEYLLDGRYTSSLYKTIALPMQHYLNNFAPMLMRSKVNPVEFEGVPVIPTEPSSNVDTKHSSKVIANCASSTINNPKS